MLHKNSRISLSVMDETDDKQLCLLGRALSTPERLQILRLLSDRPLNMLEIANALSLPKSSVSNHIDALQDAQLISIQYQPAKKGHMKLCYKATVEICIQYPGRGRRAGIAPRQRGNARRQLCGFTHRNQRLSGQYRTISV